MRILIITPCYFPHICGNSVDVHRISQGLKKKSIGVKVITPKIKEINGKFDLIHIFHAYKSRMGKEIAKKLNVPYVVTMTGTDFNIDLLNEKKETVLDVINNATSLTCISPAAQKNFKKIKLIKRGKLLIQGKGTNFRKKFNFSKTDFIFLVNAIIRPVKNVISVIKPLEKLHKEYPAAKLLFVGEQHHKDKGDYFENFKKAIANKDWITYAGRVEVDEIKDIYDAVDVVINSSLSEASPLVVEEALTLGKSVLASNIEGNKSLIKNNKNGLVFEDDLFEKAKKLYENSSLREKFYEQSKNREVNKKEIDDYISVYQEALN